MVSENLATVQGRPRYSLVGQKMNSEDALSLHNAFRRGGKWHAAHAFSCDEPPRDDLLALDTAYLVSPSADWITKISESEMLRSLAIKSPRTRDLGPLGRLGLVQFEVSDPSRIDNWEFLSKLTRLRRLVVENATTLSNFSCLENLSEVEFLMVAGGYSKPRRHHIAAVQRQALPDPSAAAELPRGESGAQ